MNDASDHMKQWLAGADAKRAENSLKWLRGLLRTGFYNGSNTLHEVIERDVLGHLRLFSEHLPLCKAVERASVELSLARSHGHDPADLRVIQVIVSLFAILQLGCEEVGAPQGTLDALDLAHGGALRQYLSFASEQLAALAGFLHDIHEFLKHIATGQSRFVLIEMPTGNSIPVKLLAKMLEHHTRVDVIRVSLSRKRVKIAGISRKALLREQLEAAKLTQHDVVVYLDEWETGSNFAGISEALEKLVPKDSLLFAAAYMSDAASPHPKYDSFCLNHDELMKPWGVPAEQYRRLLPALPSSIGGGYFFWSEHDRTAGYRKMQLHGSAFSSIDDTVGLLHRDAKALRAASQILLGQLAAENDLPGSRGEGVAATMELFEASYQDYLGCRNEFEKCADDYARGGEINDFDSIMELIIKRYGVLMNERKAKLAVCLACVYIDRVGSLDPANRYHFEDQAPVIISLEGPALNTHSIVMEVMKEHLTAAQTGGTSEYSPPSATRTLDRKKREP